MAITKITKLENCACAECKKTHYTKWEIIYKKGDNFLCSECAEFDDENLLYYALDGEAHLIVDEVSVKKLDNGRYILNDAADHYYIQSLEGEFLSNYTLEKQDNDYYLNLPEKMICPIQKYSARRFNSIVKRFQYWTGYENIFFITDSDREIIGISNLPSRRLRANNFPSRSKIHLSYTAEELEAESIKNNLSGSIAAALNEFKPKELLDYCRERIQGQGTQLKIAVYLIYRYMEMIAEGKPFTAQNWVLTAPSGMGKTEFYRCIRDFFELKNIPLPVTIIDLSQITEEGFKGINATQIPKKMLEEKPESKGYGICFFDEADKKCVPSYSNGVDVNQAVQSNLLTLVEGIRMKIDISRIDNAEFDSSRTMFIFMGAFQELRHRKMREKNSPARPSFHSKKTDDEESHRNNDAFFDNLTIDDIIKFGMREELAGRITQVVNFHKLSKENMLIIIRNKVMEISEQIGAVISLTEEAEMELVDSAYGPLGIRTPMNIIRELVQQTIAEYFFDEGGSIFNMEIVIESKNSAYRNHSRKAG